MNINDKTAKKKKKKKKEFALNYLKELSEMNAIHDS